MDHASYLRLIEETIQNGRYKADWGSLSGHKTPDWYYEGKLGIFIHWGIYSVPAYACEWYPRMMYDPSHDEYEYHRIILLLLVNYKINLIQHPLFLYS